MADMQNLQPCACLDLVEIVVRTDNNQQRITQSPAQRTAQITRRTRNRKQQI